MNYLITFTLTAATVWAGLMTAMKLDTMENEGKKISPALDVVVTLVSVLSPVAVFIGCMFIL